MHSSNSTPPAIQVVDGCKNYGKATVLQKLNMTVERGTIYALLGSSGCGKTTILSSIIGVNHLTSGSIQVFGQIASQNYGTHTMGYMPQETGLHDELTISEELHFFARLYDLEKCVAIERIDFFMNLLQLPSKQSIIRNLSSGEKRRISLAIALLHKPPLIIMDEPTVGVDPLLRQSIWEHLSKLVREEGTTVIVSTHYTEEAKQADIVSVMRYGRLLAEEPPQSLMERYGSLILEDVLIRLCRSQEMDEFPSCIGLASRVKAKNENRKIVNVSYKRRNSGVPPSNHISPMGLDTIPSNNNRNRNYLMRQFRIIYALLTVNLITFIRLPMILYMLITLPTLIASLRNVTYRTTPYTDLGVVNLEQLDCFKLIKDQQKLGCELTRYLVETDQIKLEPFTSEVSALAAANRGKNYGYFVIPRNYTQNAIDRAAFGRFAEVDTLEGSTIFVHFDLSNHVRNGFLFEAVLTGFTNFVEKKLNETSSKEFGVDISSSNRFKINQKLKEIYSVEPQYGDVSALSYLAVFIMIIPAVVGIPFVWDRKRGVLQRTIVCGASLPHFMLSALIAYGLVFLAKIMMALVALFLLGVPFNGSIVDVLIVTYGQHLVGIMFGFLLGCLLDHEIEVIFYILALTMTIVISLGEVTDIASMGYLARYFVMALPAKVPSISLQNILFRGWNIFHPKVWPCFILQAVWILTSVILCSLVYYNKQFQSVVQ